VLRNKFPLVFVLFLAACAHDQPVINTVVQKVEVPVPVPCRAEIPQTPEFNFDKLDPSATIFDKSKALLADRKLHLAYESELMVALKACKEPLEPAK
jgi:hypothetical protein